VTWFNPVHKTFYSIAGIVLGIVSFPASNLGGLFIGMLLAIIGGAIAFAWTPLQETPEPIAVPWTPDEEVQDQATLVWEPDTEATEPDAADEAESAKPAGLGPESEAALA
jgi:uncharacterized protein DUF6114